jgi:hypothetical protein
MLVVRLFEFIAVLVIFVGLVTQVIFPFLRGTVMFPIFQKEAILTNTLEKEHQKEVEKNLEKEIEEVRKKNQ